MDIYHKWTNKKLVTRRQFFRRGYFFFLPILGSPLEELLADLEERNATKSQAWTSNMSGLQIDPHLFQAGMAVS
jgi:hypothetical protein